MLRRIIERSAFTALLGMAATYALAATLGVILMADALARVSVVWPHVMPPLATVMPVDCCPAAG
jgi:hypothetical protein